MHLRTRLLPMHLLPSLYSASLRVLCRLCNPHTPSCYLQYTAVQVAGRDFCKMPSLLTCTLSQTAQAPTSSLPCPEMVATSSARHRFCGVWNLTDACLQLYSASNVPPSNRGIVALGSMRLLQRLLETGDLTTVAVLACCKACKDASSGGWLSL